MTSDADIRQADHERIGRMVCTFSKKRVLSREEIKQATGYDNEGSLDTFLQRCIAHGIIADCGGSFTLYPHVSVLFGPFYGSRNTADYAEKARIAKYAVDSMEFICGTERCRGLREMVVSTTSRPLIVDAGSSTQAVVRYLKEQVLSAQAPNSAALQVYTVNLHSAMTLANAAAEVFLPRGTVDARFAALVGRETALDVRQSFPRTGVALLGTSAINPDEGLTTVHQVEGAVKREILDKLPDVTVVAVADHTKVGPIGWSVFRTGQTNDESLRARFQHHAYVVIDELPPDKGEALKGHYRDALHYLIEHFHSPDPDTNRLKMIDTDGEPIAAPDIPARVDQCTK